MRVLIAELAPALLDVDANLARIEAIVARGTSDLAVFPELYLSGYRVGDRVGEVALGPDDPRHRRLAEIAARAGTTLVVGGPRRSPDRPGETENAALCYGPDGSFSVQAKRFLPTFGPFEEGTLFSATDESRPVRALGRSVGLEICYDLFFPEVSRDLALRGAELLIAISAAPVTSRRLFERILPARAIENALPLVYVNRVGVEDGLVFGGGSVVLDARGEELPGEKVEGPAPGPDERVEIVELDLAAASRWRPFRPVLRDVAHRRSERTPG
jgi:predicted amidohydrolase